MWEALRGFLDAPALGADRSVRITQVPTDYGNRIAAVATGRDPAAVLCADALHVVKLATEALDGIRRQVERHPRR